MNSYHYGLMAEFKKPEGLLTAMEAAKKNGYSKLDAYSPFPVDGLAELIKPENKTTQIIALVCGLTGAASGLALQYYCSTLAYPINVGGRPLTSWISYIPICFELMVLFSALGLIISLFLLNGLPEPYHPVFNVPDFSLASRNRFFIVIKSDDPLFHLEKTKDFLHGLNAEKIYEVEK